MVGERNLHKGTIIGRYKTQREGYTIAIADVQKSGCRYSIAVVRPNDKYAFAVRKRNISTALRQVVPLIRQTRVLVSDKAFQSALRGEFQAPSDDEGEFLNRIFE